jgi:FkbM family methyltransferase
MFMLNNFKKAIYHWITNQRRTKFGRLLREFNNVIYEALENKNNDFFTNGEKWLIDSLKSDSELTIFDVGANIGNWTRMVHRENYNAKIFCFEPVPAIFERLAENTKDMKGIVVNNFALGRGDDVMKMNYYPSIPIFSSFYHHPMGSSNELVVDVKVVSGDEYCKANNIDFIDFLKIDVEGFESNVLFGFQKMISEKRIKMIQFEYGDLVLDTRFLLKDFYNFFEKSGYKVGKIYPGFIEFGDYDYKKENFLTSNFVAVLSR